MNKNRLLENIVEGIRLAETSIPPDVEDMIRKAYETETSSVGKAQLKAILDNIKIAREKRLPICQDTGLLAFYIEIGNDFPMKLTEIKEIIVEATKKATTEVPLRPNAIDFWKEKNTGNNVGRNIPIIHFEPVEGEDMKIAIMPKGGGSSYVAKLYSIPPSRGIEGVKEVVIRAVFDAGPKPCPPTFLGIGIGGTEELAMFLAKKVLLQKVNKNSSDPVIAQLERELTEKANRLEIGPMGLGGKWTVLNTRINWAARHPATFLVGIVFSCWALRRAFIDVKGDEVRVYQ